MARNIFSSINESAQRHPWMFGAASTGARYFIGDMSAQRAAAQGKKRWLDYERLGLFTGFGFSYAATMGFTLYNRVYPRVLPTRPLMTAMVDAGIHTPTLYFLAFYCMQATNKAGIQTALADPAAIGREAVATWKKNFWTDLTMSLCVWVPLHYVNFRFAPVHWRQPVVAGAGLVWSGVMSVVRGAALTDSEGVEEVGESSSSDAAVATGVAGTVAVRRVAVPLASVVQAANVVPAASRASALAASSITERAPRVWAAARNAPAAAAAAGAATLRRNDLAHGRRDVAAASCASAGLSGWPWR